MLPRTIESSTTTRPLAPDHLAQRVELEPDAELADRLARLDEGAADVGVLDQALAVRDAGLLGVADRGRGAGLRHRDDQVGLDRVLHGPGVGPSRPGPRAPTGRRWWRRGGRGRRTRRRSPWGRPRRSGGTADRRRRWRSARPARSRGRRLAPTMSRAAVSLATTQPRSSRPRTSGRTPCGSRAAYRVCSSMKTRQKAPRSCGQHLERGGLEGVVRVAGEQRRDQRGVGGVAAGELAAAAAGRTARRPGRQLGGVGEVAVVGQGDGAVVGAAERRLGVLPGAATGRGVAAVADGQVALQRAQAGLVEDLRDQAHVLVDQDAASRCWRRCRPTPGRGAAARRARSR